MKDTQKQTTQTRDAELLAVLMAQLKTAQAEIEKLREETDELRSSVEYFEDETPGRSKELEDVIEYVKQLRVDAVRLGKYNEHTLDVVVEHLERGEHRR